MHATNPIRRRFPTSTVFIGLMVACAIEFFVAAAFLPAVYHRADSIGWPISTGMISGVKLNEWSHKPHTEALFKPVILYDYTVNGIAHQGMVINNHYSDRHHEVFFQVILNESVVPSPGRDANNTCCASSTSQRPSILKIPEPGYCCFISNPIPSSLR